MHSNGFVILACPESLYFLSISAIIRAQLIRKGWSVFSNFLKSSDVEKGGVRELMNQEKVPVSVDLDVIFGVALFSAGSMVLPYAGLVGAFLIYHVYPQKQFLSILPLSLLPLSVGLMLLFRHKYLCNGI